MRQRIRNFIREFLPSIKITLCRKLQHFEIRVTKYLPNRKLNFCVPLAEHCNLRCRGCDHFAPLAEETFADIDEFERDFARLSELLKGEALKIGLMGGEPLLHPRAKDFLYIARKYFPNTRIRIVSNGLLLLKQEANFWKSCNVNNIIIEITKYPINLDFNQMKTIADRFGVTLEFYDNTGTVQKTSHYVPLDPEGKQDARKNFRKCFHANFTIFLRKGKLFTCTVVPNIGHFNKYFNMNLATSASDSIDIYKAQSAQEIFEFLSKPIPFCRYCYVDKRTSENPWKRSSKDIKEWTV